MLHCYLWSSSDARATCEKKAGVWSDHLLSNFTLHFLL